MPRLIATRGLPTAVFHPSIANPCRALPNHTSACPDSRPKDCPYSVRTMTQAWPKAHEADCCLEPQHWHKVVDSSGQRGFDSRPSRQDQPVSPRLRHGSVSPESRSGLHPLWAVLEDRIYRFLLVDRSFQRWYFEVREVHVRV